MVILEKRNFSLPLLGFQQHTTMETISLKVKLSGQESYCLLYKVLRLKMHGTIDNCKIYLENHF